MQLKDISRGLLSYLNMEPELEDSEIVFEEIKKGIFFKGTNLWILIFAIIIASVGLNMNSTAVIIGAMLISPLMGPINGMGYSIATFDLELFRKSIKNFTFAIIAGLVSSTIYFLLSPVSTAHSELLARTSPTIYDVLIALFGGLAGIVAVSSKNKGNVIPGVAIATALMPPLCTAGYGIATGQINFFLGAMYLFTINTIFIAMASVWISQILKFPIRSDLGPAKKRKINQLISIIIIVVLMPSIYFGYKLVKKEKFNLNAKEFIAKTQSFEGNILLKHAINSDEQYIELVFGGKNWNENQLNLFIDRAKLFNLDQNSIKVQQGLTINELDNLQPLEIINKIAILEDSLQSKVKQINELTSKGKLGKNLLDELNIIWPEIVAVSFLNSEMFFRESEQNQELALVLIVSQKVIKQDQKSKIKDWISSRLENESIKVIFEE
ncbi:MAG TPA: TIGR00341 family protein [Saprospiraceae bacterium]|nr:TIGR00341 family protein [Saprospiraceae bacterium]